MDFKTFTLEISVCEKCNLACPYCYIPNRNNFMTKETFDDGLVKVLELMDRAKTSRLNVSFFGGEPMLNWDLIVHATTILQRLPIVSNIVILSNMTMLDEGKLRWIQDAGVGVSWSFDGMSSNESRPLLPMLENRDKDGNQYDGIIDLYKDNIHLIKELTQGCKVMIWPGNMHEMVDNIDFFLDMGVTNPDYSLVRDDVWTKDDIIKFREHMFELGDRYIEIIRSGVYFNIGFFTLGIMDNIMGLTNQKRDFGCFAGVHGAVLMSSGEFYPCARFASKSLMKIDENYSFEYWKDQFNPLNFDKCKTCDIRNVCNAGCSYSQVRNDNKPLDSICELFHIVQEQTQRVVHELRDEPLFHKILGDTLRNAG